MKVFRAAFVAFVAYVAYSLSGVTWSAVPYRISTSVNALRALAAIPREDYEQAIKAYEFLFQGSETAYDNHPHVDQEVETEHVRAWYRVIQQLLSVLDIEKLYIPPQHDRSEGLFVNQQINEQKLAATLNVGPGKRVLDAGCGRGRIAHYISELTGSKVSGFNIDGTQIDAANAYAKETMSGNDFQVGDVHKRYPYEDATFDAVYSVNSVPGFLRKHEMDHSAREMFRVLKPGGVYSCSEYLLTPDFNHNNSHHVKLHQTYMGTLSASQSNYPKDYTDALERAGFQLVLSAPSEAPAFPLCEQKTELFKMFGMMLQGLSSIGLIPDWGVVVVNQLMRGGDAWTEAERAKIADLNWRIIMKKP